MTLDYNDKTDQKIFFKILSNLVIQKLASIDDILFAESEFIEGNLSEDQIKATIELWVYGLPEKEDQNESSI